MTAPPLDLRQRPGLAQALQRRSCLKKRSIRSMFEMTRMVVNTSAAFETFHGATRRDDDVTLVLFRGTRRAG